MKCQFCNRADMQEIISDLHDGIYTTVFWCSRCGTCVIDDNGKVQTRVPNISKVFLVEENEKHLF